MTDFRQGVYCQQCATVIWISLQSSQFCTACGFGAHYACMDNIMRTCVAIKAKTQPDFIMDICPERILPQLKYRCVECDKKFCKTRPPRLCDYTGLCKIYFGIYYIFGYISKRDKIFSYIRQSKL